MSTIFFTYFLASYPLKMACCPEFRNNFSFFATNHRPDSVFSIKDELRIAIEIKKGDSGSALRSGIGQALVYSTQFHFVIYFFVDISPGNDIKSSFTGKKEKELINSLWKNYNIKFKVV